MNYIPVLEEIFRQFEGPKFSLKLWDNKKRFYGSGKSPAFTLTIEDAATAQRLLSQGSLGFGEAYMEGSIKIDGSLETYLRLRHQFKKIQASPRLALAKFLAKRKIPKERKNQIAYHYDLGNDFFQMILDKKTMSYSAGLFQTGLETLERAQLKKLDYICKSLKLPQGSSVLDLGSGWGGFADYSSKIYKWHVTGYTLSQDQLEYSRQQVKKSKAEDLIKFEYRDMFSDLPALKYDGIIMIESVEHFGKKPLTPFFKKIKTRLKRGSTFIIQTTGRYNPKRVDKWTLKYVFPGGYLPSKDEFLNSARDGGFIVEEFRDDTKDYVYTMSEWIKNLETNRKNIEKKFDQKFYRLWELWMHGAKVNFELGEMSLFRIKMRLPK